jgi:hypothetical protein
MHRFIEGADRAQASLLPASLEDYVDADNPVRVIEAFVDALDLDGLGIAVIPAATGTRPPRAALRPTDRSRAPRRYQCCNVFAAFGQPETGKLLASFGMALRSSPSHSAVCYFARGRAASGTMTWA